MRTVQEVNNKIVDLVANDRFVSAQPQSRTMKVENSEEPALITVVDEETQTPSELYLTSGSWLLRFKCNKELYLVRFDLKTMGGSIL